MLFINLVGFALIALIVWWFWLYKPKEIEAMTEDLIIRVKDGTYQPARIQISANRPTRLTFLRLDETPCAETVVFPDSGVSEELPLNKKHSLSLPAMTPGEYDFHCQMQMYRGTLVVKSEGGTGSIL